MEFCKTWQFLPLSKPTKETVKCLLYRVLPVFFKIGKATKTGNLPAFSETKN